MVDADLAGGQKVCNSCCRNELEKRSKCEGRARLHEEDSRCVVGQEKRDGQGTQRGGKLTNQGSGTLIL